MSSNWRRSTGDDDKGLLWKLPQIRIKDVGKVGPALGLGVGCGFGFGAGLIGGVGFGPGVPGLQFGLGFGAGCGIGVGFGYGVGRGAAYDHSRSYSNVGKPSLDEVDSLIDELVVHTKKLVKATSKEIDKWRRAKSLATQRKRNQRIWINRLSNKNQSMSHVSNHSQSENRMIFHISGLDQSKA